MSLENYVEKEEFEGRRFNGRVLSRLLRDLFRERTTLALGVSLVFINTGAMLYEPRLFGRAIDQAIIPKDFDKIGMFAKAYFGLIVIRIVTVILQQYLFERLSQDMMQRLRLQLFMRYQALLVSTYDRTPVGKLITRITNDTSAMSEMFSAGFVTFFGNLLFIFGSFVWIFILNWKLAIVATSVFPILIYFAIHFSRRLVEFYRKSRMELSALNAFLAENILGMRVVHLFNRVDRHLSRFKEVSDRYSDHQISAVRIYAYFQPLITWCSGTGVALVLAYGGGMALKGELTTGGLVAFTSYLLALFQPVREVVDRWTIFLSGMTSAERIYSVLDWDVEMPLKEAHAPLPVKLERFRGDIRFENVWFAYQKTEKGETWVLKDFSLEIKAGQKIGIVGHTGAGKSTLIGLLLRFYEPNQGRITIDGKDIREIPKRELRARIGLIQQDVFIFSGCVEENLTLWKNEKQGDVRPETLKALESLKFPYELQRELDERGANLSMGEKQILAFARALESHPDIWILDEATSNVDSETEERLGKALEDATGKKTLLMIAHRLATIRRSDRIIVMHKGELAEAGTHDELLKKGGYYARLYRYQAALEKAEMEGLKLQSALDSSRPALGPSGETTAQTGEGGTSSEPG